MTEVSILGSKVVAFVNNVYFEFAWNGKLVQIKDFAVSVRSMTINARYSLVVVGTDVTSHIPVVGMLDVVLEGSFVFDGRAIGVRVGFEVFVAIVGLLVGRKLVGVIVGIIVGTCEGTALGLSDGCLLVGLDVLIALGEDVIALNDG